MTKLHTSRSRILQAALTLFTLVALSSLPLFGQASSGYGAIAGTATDPSGSVVPNVAVRVRNVGTNAVQTLETNAVGRYQALSLQPGDYEITAIKSGFANLVRTGVTVAIGQIAVVDLNLTVAGTTETITVAANTATVETEKTEVSTVVNTKDMMNLPLNGRRWDAFVMTTPGATNDGGFGLITFRGISGLYNNNMVDGMDNNQAFFSEARGRTRLSYAISPEAIQEFQVGASNFSSQYGRSAGGTVNAVTRSGTNDIHGTFYYIIRDESLNASNSVASLALIRLGLPPKPKDRRQQFGPSVGGAIKKDKLFYFLSYDQQKRAFPAVIVPGASSFLTQTGTAPGFSNVLNFYQGLTGPQDRAGSQWLGLSRVDYNITNNNQISTTVNILRWDSPNGIQTAPTHANHSSANGSDNVNNEIVIVRWNSIVTPNFISDLRFQYGRDLEFQSANAPGPSVGVTNGINFGMPNFLPRPAYPNEKRYQVAQNLSWLRGRHSLKFGYDLNWVDDQLINLFQGGGQYDYSTLNDLVLDCPNLTLPLGACNATAGTGITGRHYTSYQQQFDTLGLAGTAAFRNTDLAFYLEDSFKPFQTLTINMGLRYDVETMPSLQGNPDVPATNNINVDKNNFGPRIGLAWDPTRSHSTVFRAGAGMYYGRTQNSTVSNFITNNGQRFKGYFFLPSTAGAPAFPNVLTDIPTGAAGKPNALFAAPDFVNPLIYQMEFSVEREVFHNFTVTGVYMATRGQHLPLFRDTNLFPTTQTATYTVCAVPQVGSATTCPQVAQTATVPFYSGSRPNANFGFMTQGESVVNTWYNGFVLQARQRFSRGFQMQAALTISKAQDNDQISQTFSANNQPLDPMNVRNDYSLSNFDQRKRFTMSAVWQPPFSRLGSKPLRRVLDGFQLSGILALTDGRPYSPSVSGNPTPSGVSSGLLGAGGDFRVPFVGRNVFTSPGAATVDVRLARDIKISERFHWQLIAEAFNLFNRDNVTSIATTQYNIRNTVLFPRTDFQAITATGTNLFRERQLQFGTRFTF
jgi:hypothetical protein